MPQWDTMTYQQLLWVGGAAIAIAALIFAMLYPPARKSKKLTLAKSNHGAGRQSDEGWFPTGRIDFTFGENGSFILQVEDTRTVDSISGIERREMRWRRATLDEAKSVHHTVGLNN